MPWNPATLKALRNRKKLTQGELAAQVGVLRVTVARWETGTREPTIAGLEGLAKALKVPITALLK